METVTSSTRDRSAEIDRCLSMIVPSASNESKFVGMLMLPKLLDQNNNKDVEKVFEQMNFKFLERLLRTSHSIDGEVPDSTLKEIAVNVLSCFARYPQLASQQNMVDRIPALSRLLTPNDETETTSEVLLILSLIAVQKEGLVKMLDPDVLENILRVLVQSDDEQLQKKCTNVITSVYRWSTFLLVEKKIPSLSSALKFSLATLVSYLSKALKHDQKTLKFEALDILRQVIPTVPEEIMKQFIKEQEQSKHLQKWLDDFLDGLRQILTSKIPSSKKQAALTLNYCLLQHFGTDWFFKSLQDTKAAKRKKEKASTDKASDPANKAYAIASFPALVIHLVAIEAKLLVDEINDRVMKEQDESNKTMNAETLTNQQLMVRVYLETLEAGMEYLAAHCESSGMEAEMLLKIRTTLSEVMDVVAELLNTMRNSDSNWDQDPIAQACANYISIWLAEEGYEVPENTL